MLRASVAVLSAMLMAGAAWAGETQVVVVQKPDTSQSTPYYPGNRPPLLPSPFIRLPTGTVKPQGWVRRQPELEAEGYIGHVGEVSGYQYNEVTFDPVKTTELKIEIQFRPGRCGSLIRWRVE
ncbi:MAG TPA: hypothetical protein VM238_00725 [Phycisphaerae bacterium]|nr:hypothetical protein [Phycisphaerae bacterium]